MKKKKRKTSKAPLVEKVQQQPGTVGKSEPDGQNDYGEYGGIPMRDLKKNLGCG